MHAMGVSACLQRSICICEQEPCLCQREREFNNGASLHKVLCASLCL